MRNKFILLGSSLFTALAIMSSEGCQKEAVSPNPPDPVVTDSIINVDQTPLPAFNELLNHYLQYGPHLPNNGTSDEDFATVIGGLFKQNVDSNIFTNTCASRVSHALNLSGDPIPHMSGKTSSGGNGFKYLFRVIDLRSYMIHTYGEPDQQGNNMNDFIGKKGIIIFNTQGLWNESVALGGNYADKPSFYFDNSVNVMLWVAK